MRRECTLIAESLTRGAVIEPLIHPKPGGVTRIDSSGNHTIYDFILASTTLQAPLELACNTPCVNGRLEAPTKLYLESLARLGVRGNVNSGTFLLLVHLAFASTPLRDPEVMARDASQMIGVCGGVRDAMAYYELLRSTPRSFMGYYEGPLGDAVRGAPQASFYEILSHTRWDHVHRELLEGYPLSLRVYRILSREDFSEELVARIALELLAREGDTMIARKYGWRAFQRAREEARIALWYSERVGIGSAVGWLRKRWSSRGWSPGAILDVIAAGLGLYFYGLLSREGLSRS